MKSVPGADAADDNFPWWAWPLTVWLAWAAQFVTLGMLLDSFSGWVGVTPDLVTEDSVENWRVTGRPLYRGERLYRWR